MASEGKRSFGEKVKSERANTVCYQVAQITKLSTDIGTKFNPVFSIIDVQKVFVLFCFHHPTNEDVRYIDFGSIDTPDCLECLPLGRPE
jgi:hypothetical protein